MANERLFRDDAGAALERVACLEEENARLRAEIERLRAGASRSTPLRGGPNAATELPTLPRAPSPWVLLGMAAAPAFVGVGLIAWTLSPAPEPRPPVVDPPRVELRGAAHAPLKSACARALVDDTGRGRRLTPSCRR
jgi:uncharacterized small protein (DUF1192 family)